MEIGSISIGVLQGKYAFVAQGMSCRCFPPSLTQLILLNSSPAGLLGKLRYNKAGEALKLHIFFSPPEKKKKNTNSETNKYFF